MVIFMQLCKSLSEGRFVDPFFESNANAKIKLADPVDGKPTPGDWFY